MNLTPERNMSNVYNPYPDIGTDPLTDSGMQGMQNVYKPAYQRSEYEMPAQQNTEKTSALDKGTKQLGTGILTGNPYFIYSGLITLAGGLLEGLTRREPRLTPQEQAYADMIGYYKKVGERMKIMNEFKRNIIPNRKIPVQLDWRSVVNDIPYRGE